MGFVVDLIREYGFGIVFLNVLHLIHVIRSIATQSHLRATTNRHLWHKYIIR